jgi:hypothetical protein
MGDTPGDIDEQCAHTFTITVSGDAEIRRTDGERCKYNEEEQRAAHEEAKTRLKRAVADECSASCGAGLRCTGVLQDSVVTYTTRSQGAGEQERCFVVCTITAKGHCECRPTEKTR